MRHALCVGLLVVAACKGKSAGTHEGSGAGSGSAAPPQVAPVDLAQAKVTLGCLFGQLLCVVRDGLLFGSGIQRRVGLSFFKSFLSGIGCGLLVLCFANLIG